MSDNETHSLIKVAAVLGKIQRKLESEGVDSMIGGGAGVDLLREKHLPAVRARRHGDGDLYIPAGEKQRVLEVLEKDGLKIQKNWTSLTDVINVRKGKVRVDLFLMRGSPEEPIVGYISPADEINVLQNPNSHMFSLNSEKMAFIDPNPEVVSVGKQTLKVLNAKSLLAIHVMAAGDEPKRVRDLAILKKILGE